MNAERETCEVSTTLYGIIVGLGYLKRAYTRDTTTATEWPDTFSDFIYAHKYMNSYTYTSVRATHPDASSA